MVRPVSQLWSLWDDRRIEGEIASDDDEQQVRRQVRHLLKVDEEYPVNIIADEDAQRAFRDINLSHVSASCMKIVVNLICASIQQANNTPMSYLDTKLMQGGEVVFRGACQRRGTPGFLEHSRKGTKTPSKKCNCHFFFTLYSDSTLKFHYHDHNQGQLHHPDCHEVHPRQTASSTGLQRMLASPSAERDIVSEVARSARRDGTLRARHLGSIIKDAVTKFLPPGLIPAVGYMRRLMKRSLLEASDGIALENQLQALETILRANENYKVAFLQQADEAGGNQYRYVSVVMSDKRLLPPVGEDILVVTSDVTFGVTDPRTGFDKLDMVTMLTAGREVFPLAVALITNEDSRTFEHNFRFILEEYPHLETAVFVLLVDGDPAKILAARTVFKNVIIILCLYHLMENFAKHCRPNFRGALNGAEGLEATVICNCSVCGVRVDMPLNGVDATTLQAVDAINARCEQCSCASADCGSSDTDTADEIAPACTAAPVVGTGASWFNRGTQLLAGVAASLLPSALRRQSHAPEATQVSLFENALKSNVSWYQCWDKIRHAPTLAECKQLLDGLAACHPNLADYCAYLWRNKGMWVECTFAWELTFG